MYEHAIVCVKIVAGCKVLFVAVAIQDALDKIFLFIHYLYVNEIQPQKQEKDQVSELIYAKKAGES